MVVRDGRLPKNNDHLSRVDLNVTTNQPQMNSGQSTVSRGGVGENVNNSVVVG